MERRLANPTPRRRHFRFDAKGVTETALRYLRGFGSPFEIFDFTQICSVVAVKEGIPCRVEFILNDGRSIEVENGFNIGYGGEGPTGLYRVLLDAGFSVDDAYKVFERDITYLSLTK